MAVHHVSARQLARPQQNATGQTRIPAPYRGLDTRVPVAMGNPEVCTFTYNLVPGDGGLVTRKGFREWQIAVDAGSGLSVNTIVPYEGLAVDGSDDRLFAVTNEGIWDVTTSGAAPVSKFTFVTQTEDAGYGVWVNYITDAGVKVVFYADSLNGLFSYDVATDTWAQTTGVTGATVANVNFVMVHKQRIWLIERDSSDAWYLGIGAITGAATKFSFGSKMKSGGSLRGLFSWTVDGGAGVDDLFVGVSGSGDVFVYQGDDPSAAATWALRGVYFIGDLPKGPKFGTEQGGELYLLSVYGLTTMSDLLKGTSAATSPTESPTAPITSLIRQDMTLRRDDNGWAVRSIPSEGGLLVSRPTPDNSRPLQFFYNTSIKGWGFWRDLDINAFGTWRGSVVFGDTTLRVNYMDIVVDNALLTPISDINGDPITFSMLTSFSDLGQPSVFKRVKYIRPDFIASTKPTFATTVRYDYLQDEGRRPLADGTDAVAVWDIGVWDVLLWGGDAGIGWSRAFGSFGIGRNVAVAVRGETYVPITLVGFDAIYDVGGSML